MVDDDGKGGFVRWFRGAAPYIHAFRERTFVIAFGGEVVNDGRFVALTHDLSLLSGLGVRLVLVHGARPQIEARLREAGARIRYVAGLRVTDAQALACVKEAVGRVRVEVEALLSMGLPNSPMAGADIRVASGNYVTARPAGVVEGVDLQHTGEVRKLDTTAIRCQLDAGAMVLLSPLGYSPTGEIFNLTLQDVATRAAVELGADKLIFLMESAGVEDAGALLRELTANEAEKLLSSRGGLPEEVRHYLACAAEACRQGVPRAHLISGHTDGALLMELFTREGVGTMVAADRLQALRQATADDVGGIVALIEPLEAEGTLVRRGRELLEREVERFHVVEHDGMIVGCAALYPFPREKAAELACLAVHPDFRNAGHGDLLLEHVESLARKSRLRRLFVLTTRAAHWFIERGFREAGIGDLPADKQAMYNWQRRSKVLLKTL